jgi:4-hydroxyproline epimerase
MQRIKVIDSHTGGEPTRIIVDGGPSLGTGPLPDRVAIFREKFDHIRSAVVNEPRGSDVLVGGLLCEPIDPAHSAAVIFFTTVGYLGMCGHGTIGLVTTLKHIGRISAGRHTIETPVGLIVIQLATDGLVSVQNVPSYRHLQNVTVQVPTAGEVTGDVAWGGNWFFLVKNCQQELSLENKPSLLDFTRRIRDALIRDGITGAQGAYIDHIELFGPPRDSANQSRNFVLCPGGDYDRSPCGTGSSAKLACMAADGQLAEGEIWRQESIVGSVFACSYQRGEGHTVIPTIRGRAHISGEATLILDPTDPFCMGIRS